MKPVDLLGFGPKRTVVKNGDGTYTVTVTPPEITKLPASTLDLTDSQYERFRVWEGNTGVLIQDALPDLTGAERELLMTGINDETFHKMFADDDEDEILAGYDENIDDNDF